MSVVIVTYNSMLVLPMLIASLPEGLAGVEHDIIVVDNGSTDGSADLVESLVDAHVIRSTNEGYAAAINRGVTASSASHYLVLNPDTVLEPGSVAALMDASWQPRTGIVAPVLLDEDGRQTASLRREPSILRSIGLTRTRRPIFSEYVFESKAYTQGSTADWAVGAALLISRECHDRVGGWDPSYFLYSEETDFCLRARDFGLLTRYEPTAVISHRGGGSGRNAQTHAMQLVNRVRAYARRHGAVSTGCYFATTVLSQASWALRGSEESKVALIALVSPRHRPPELRASDRLIPD